jgi:hypothetical protein
MGTLMHMVSQDASVIAFDYVFRICALLFIAALPILLVVRRGAPAFASSTAQPIAEAA